LPFRGRLFLPEPLLAEVLPAEALLEAAGEFEPARRLDEEVVAELLVLELPGRPDFGFRLACVFRRPFDSLDRSPPALADVEVRLVDFPPRLTCFRLPGFRLPEPPRFEFRFPLP
jgi:hypothetical protein